MSLFCEVILKCPTGSSIPQYSTTLDVIIQTMLDFIRIEREGDTVDKSMLRECTRMLEGLYNSKNEADDTRLYSVDFEPAFLETSRQFYRAEGERMVRESDAGQYCRHATRRIIEEQDRCLTTLSESTAFKIEKVVCDELIDNKIKEIIEMDTGVKFMILNDRFEELALVYQLNARVDSKVAELTKAVQDRIQSMGAEINQAALSDRGDASMNSQTLAAIKWVEEVLDLKDRFDRIWKSSFNTDQQLQTSMTVSFRDFINSTAFNRASEYISLFIDENMKKGIKDKTDDEVDRVLDKAIVLLRYIQDRDMFERYYKKHLARRLLMAKSVSIDVEKQMIGKMKIELGNSFTAKLEAMFKDMTISDELSSSFKAHVAALQDPQMSAAERTVELGVHILTSMTWPLDSAADEQGQKVVYPQSILKLQERFKHYYSKQHTGRRLTFQPNMGTADVKVRFPPLKPGGKERVHEFNVSTYAMIVLLLFQDLPAGESLSFLEIHARTNLPPHDLIRNLQALAVASKTRILRKEPFSKDVKDNDRFSFNESFTSKFMRVKVGVVAAGNRVENERERMKTEKKIDENRGFLCEAAVVRIMKSVFPMFGFEGYVLTRLFRQRKILSHAQLITETISQLTHFKPEISMIKSRIETLIEREYLERIEDGNKYQYLA
jgi:cullin 3